ncbi:MAG: HAD family hydrolase [Chloroflexota bacterium]
MSIRAVLFDLDDTLFDHHAGMRAGVRAARALHTGLASRPFDEVVADHSRILEEMHIEFLAGRVTFEGAWVERFRRLLTQYELDHEPQTPVELAATYRAAMVSSRRIVPGADDLLQCLRGRVSIGIVTNNTRREQETKLAHLGLDQYVDDLVTSEEIGAAKPSPEIYHAALQRVGCRADEAVMLGDNWYNDVHGATLVGIRAIWLNRHGLDNPDPRLAPEINALLPVESTAALILGD